MTKIMYRVTSFNKIDEVIIEKNTQKLLQLRDETDRIYKILEKIEFTTDQGCDIKK